jgi:hypothetical protein
VAPSGSAASADDHSANWSAAWPLLVAVFGLLLWAGSAYKLEHQRREEQRWEAQRCEREREERRESERQREREKEREEQARRQQVREERKSTEREYGQVGAQFADLITSCGAQAGEMIRARKIFGIPVVGETATEVVLDDITVILSVISDANGEVPGELGRLSQAICARLSPDTYTSARQHRASINERRRQRSEVYLPETLTLLDEYDRAKNTRFAASAAKAFSALVRAACEVAGNGMAATTFVRDTYLQRLTPYLSGSGDNGEESEERSGQDACRPTQSAYELLGIKPGCTREELENAKKQKTIYWHEDRYKHLPIEIKRYAKSELDRVLDAYAKLSQEVS